MAWLRAIPKPPGRMPRSARFMTISAISSGSVWPATACCRFWKLNPGAGIGDVVEQHARKAQVGDADFARRIELAAPFDGVQ